MLFPCFRQYFFAKHSTYVHPFLIHRSQCVSNNNNTLYVSTAFISRPLDEYLTAKVSAMLSNSGVGQQHNAGTTDKEAASTTTTAASTTATEPHATQVLCLLRVLDAINRYVDTLQPPHSMLPQLLMDSSSREKPKINTSEFVSTKLTAKLTRQLQDPLMLCTGALPNWCKMLTSLFPFLFPFEVRRLYMASTAFGIARALKNVKLTLHGREVQIGRIERRKVLLSFILIQLYASILKLSILFLISIFYIFIYYNNQTNKGEDIAWTYSTIGIKSDGVVCKA